MENRMALWGSGGPELRKHSALVPRRGGGGRSLGGPVGCDLRLNWPSTPPVFPLVDGGGLGIKRGAGGDWKEGHPLWGKLLIVIENRKLGYRRRGEEEAGEALPKLLCLRPQALRV